MMKKIGTFTKFLIIFSMFLTGLCVYGWIEVGKFADNLEITLQNRLQNNENVTEFEPITLNIEEYDDFRILSFEIAEKYAKFTSGDLNFSEIKPYFQAGSDILTSLESYSSRRYDDHDEVSVQNLTFHLLQDLGNEQFVARVTFEYLVQVDGVTLEYPSDYSIYFDEESKKITALAMN